MKLNFSLCLGFICAFQMLFAQQIPDYIIFENIHVVQTFPEVKIIENQDVYISNESIDFFEDHKKKKGYPSRNIINGKGKYLMPGMADMHSHFPNAGPSSFDKENYFFLNLANGVTTLRTMRGAVEHLEWKKKIALRTIDGPNLYVSTPPFSYDRNLSPYTSRILLEAYQRDGFDFVKYLGGMTPALYKEFMQIANELNFTVAGHAPKSGLVGAIESNQKSIEHIGSFVKLYNEDPEKFEEMILIMAKEKIYNCPDIFWYLPAYDQFTLEELKEIEGLDYVDQSVKKHWIDGAVSYFEKSKEEVDKFEKEKKEGAEEISTYMKLLKKMDSKNVPLLISGGSGNFVIPGFSMLEEMRLFKKAGLSNKAIIKAATINAAHFFGKDTPWGSIEVGKQANLIMLESNPIENLESLRSIQGVMLRGKWFSKKAIDKKLELMKN